MSVDIGLRALAFQIGIVAILDLSRFSDRGLSHSGHGTALGKSTTSNCVVFLIVFIKKLDM